MRTKCTSQGYPTFPRTLDEFQRRFVTEKSCLVYLAKVRWPRGFDCPRCRNRQGWKDSPRSFRCRRCRKEIHLTAGTIMHRSHLPLRHWFWAAYLMGTMTPGISALQLQRQLGIGSYESALYLCRRLRRAMVNPQREPLKGIVEVDDAFIGGKGTSPKGHHMETKAPIVAAVENRGNHTGRIRLQVVPQVTRKELYSFIQNNVAPGSQIRTDGWHPYRGIEVYGYEHIPRVQGRSYKGRKRAGEILPWVHRVIGNLKTWLRGTHHGVDREHLQSYLDEFTFRYNRRYYREQSFLTLLVLTTQVAPSIQRRLKVSASSG